MRSSRRDPSWGIPDCANNGKLEKHLEEQGVQSVGGKRQGRGQRQIECGANKFTFIPADWLASTAKHSRMVEMQGLYHLNPQNDNYFRQALSEQQLPSAAPSKSLALFLEAVDSIKKKLHEEGRKSI